MNNLVPYPAYKESRVAWLGEIPAHWSVTAFKRGYQATLGKMLQPEPKSEEDVLVPYLRSANILWGGVDVSTIKEMWFSPTELKKYKLEYGDLVINEGGDAGRATIWLAEIEDCYIQNAVHRVRPHNGFSNKYAYYWLFLLKKIGFIDLVCNKSTIMHLTGEKLNELPLLYQVEKTKVN